MPRQNRITPSGQIIATSARGTLMGNRGCLHNQQQQIQRVSQLKRWIICRLEFKGRRRTVMTPGHYTELFFLDEATALSAGHRPCAECSRERFNDFRSQWAQANPEWVAASPPTAPLIDTVLHRERITASQTKITYPEELARLSDGSFISLQPGGQPYLVLGNKLLAWRPHGYTQPLPRPADAIVQVLTPRSSVRTLAQGYRPTIHPSAFQTRFADVSDASG